jgi:hypothetical protein
MYLCWVLPYNRGRSLPSAGVSLRGEGRRHWSFPEPPVAGADPPRAGQAAAGDTAARAGASASFSAVSSTGRPGHFFGVSVSSNVGNARSRMSFASADMVILGSGSPSLLFRFRVSIALFRFRVS